MTAVSAGPLDRTAEQSVDRDTLRKALLVCGILSSLLYVAMNVIVARQWVDYSSASQTISELSAVGAPTRLLWQLLAIPYTLLVVAFGWGVWKSGATSRALRITGTLIIAFGSLGVVWPFAPMHLREVLAAGGGTTTDTMHLTLGMASVLLMLLAIGFASTTFGSRFRIYSIATLIVAFACGAMTGLDAASVQANRPTPLVGVWERMSVGAFLLWVVVLATLLLRARDRRGQG